MRNSLFTAPRWVLVLVYGVPFGLWTGLFGRFGHHESWTEALVSGGLSGLFFGLVMGLLVHRWNAQTRSTAGDLSPADWRQVARAGRRGAAPDDPAIREAAVATLELQRARIARQRPWGLPFMLLMTGLAVWFALTRTPWWWLGAALFAAVIVTNLVAPARLRRRIDRLRDAER